MLLEQTKGSKTFNELESRGFGFKSAGSTNADDSFIQVILLGILQSKQTPRGGWTQNKLHAFALESLAPRNRNISSVMSLQPCGLMDCKLSQPQSVADSWVHCPTMYSLIRMSSGFDICQDQGVEFLHCLVCALLVRGA